MATNHAPTEWPELAAAVGPLLMRMSREDLAGQLRALPVRRADDLAAGRRSFFLVDGRRRYSLELDFSHWTVEVDVGEGERLVALHVLPAQD